MEFKSLKCPWCQYETKSKYVEVLGVSNQKLCEHVLKEHKIMIVCPEELADLAEYLFLRKADLDLLISQSRSAAGTCLPPVAFGCSIHQRQLSHGDPSMALDREIRLKIHEKVVENIVRYVTQERNAWDSARKCIFCEEAAFSNRKAYFHHLAARHSFWLGREESLVFVSQLLDKL